MGKQSPPSAQPMTRPAMQPGTAFVPPQLGAPAVGPMQPGSAKQAALQRLPQARTNLIAAHPAFGSAVNPLYRALQANARMGGRSTTMPVSRNSG